MHRWSITKGVALSFLVVLAVPGCTSGGRSTGAATSPSGSVGATPSAGSAPPPVSVAAVCADLGKIDREVSPVLDRLRSGTETKAQFQQDVLTVDQLSTGLDQDDSGFATTDPDVFAVLANLTNRLDHIAFAEDMLTDPAMVTPSDISLAQAAIAQADRATRDGLLPCSTGG